MVVDPWKVTVGDGRDDGDRGGTELLWGGVRQRGGRLPGEDSRRPPGTHRTKPGGDMSGTLGWDYLYGRRRRRTPRD